MENVIVLGFDSLERAKDALTALQRLQDAGETRLRGAAIVERTEQGILAVPVMEEQAQFGATAAGGIIGALLGLLTGPVGLVVGGATGALVGSLLDVADVHSADRLLESFGRVVPQGHAAVVAVVFEPAPRPVNALASRLGATLLRRRRAEVELEIAEAEEAVLAARRQEDSKRTVGDRVKDLREAGLHRR